MSNLPLNNAPSSSDTDTVARNPKRRFARRNSKTPAMLTAASLLVSTDPSCSNEGEFPMADLSISSTPLSSPSCSNDHVPKKQRREGRNSSQTPETFASASQDVTGLSFSNHQEHLKRHLTFFPPLDEDDVKWPHPPYARSTPSTNSIAASPTSERRNSSQTPDTVASASQDLISRCSLNDQEHPKSDLPFFPTFDKDEAKWPRPPYARSASSNSSAASPAMSLRKRVSFELPDDDDLPVRTLLDVAMSPLAPSKSPNVARKLSLDESEEQITQDATSSLLDLARSNSINESPSPSPSLKRSFEVDSMSEFDSQDCLDSLSIEYDSNDSKPGLTNRDGFCRKHDVFFMTDMTTPSVVEKDLRLPKPPLKFWNTEPLPDDGGMLLIDLEHEVSKVSTHILDALLWKHYRFYQANAYYVARSAACRDSAKRMHLPYGSQKAWWEFVFEVDMFLCRIESRMMYILEELLRRRRSASPEAPTHVVPQPNDDGSDDGKSSEQGEEPNYDSEKSNVDSGEHKDTEKYKIVKNDDNYKPSLPPRKRRHHK